MSDDSPSGAPNEPADVPSAEPNPDDRTLQRPVTRRAAKKAKAAAASRPAPKATTSAARPTAVGVGGKPLEPTSSRNPGAALRVDPADRLAALGVGAKKWGLRLLAVVVAIAVVVWLVGVAVHVQVTRLWYASVQAGSVYGTILRTEVLLFVVFGLVAAAVCGASAAVVLRTKPLEDGEDDVPPWRRWTRAHDRLVTRALLAFALVVPALKVGSAAAAHWQVFQLWAHASSWGQQDPTFHRDVSYYVEVYPMHRLVVNLAGSVVMWAVWVTLIAALVHGTIRLRGTARGVSRVVVAQLSAIGVAYLVVRAVRAWLDRAGLVLSNRSLVTGASYTDLHAVSPGKIVMIVVLLLLAGLLVLNVRRRKLRLLALTVAVTLVAQALIGSGWPSLVMQLRERPSAAALELPLIQQNQKATSDAFGLTGNVASKPYGGQEKTLSGAALKTQAARNAQVRVLDPNRLSPTFNVKQQLQAYYGFKSTLDVDRYPVGGKSTDVAIAARELYPQRVAVKSWANTHLVYTHGYGVAAAPTDSLDHSSDVPTFLDSGTSTQQIPVTHPDIYFGQSPMKYSIVGEAPGSSRKVEFDHPSGSGSAKSSYTTYTGGGGVPIGSFFHRLLYAASLSSPNILFSGQINSGSRILTVRNPSARVSAVAPWLTLDGDVYPSVVDGHIQWIVDGYTTSNNFPGSQQVNLHQATTSTLTTSGSVKAQPNRSVNYMRNSVKATVDAYTGKVTLYEWNQAAQPDPLLKTWESVFPGLVKPQSDMSSSLLAHLRYPQDLFEVQRLLLTKYHVADPSDFYSGNDFWKVPTDPTVAATKQLNAGGAGGGSSSSSPSQPPVYMSLSADGFGAPKFTLSTPLVTLNRHDLAGYLTVNAEPGPDYGKFTLLDFPPGGGSGSPSQVQNDIESTTAISEALTLQRGGNSKVVLGNLLTLPLGGRMLYVEPIYTQAQGGDSFPILRHVVAIYGDGSPAFTLDLPSALRQALASGDRPNSSGG